MLSVIALSGILGMVLLTSFYRISLILNKKRALEKHFSVRVTLDFFINTTLAIIFSSIILYVVLYWISPQPTAEIWDIFKEGFFTLWILMIVLVLFYNVSMLVLYAYTHYVEGQIVQVKMERKQLKLQFEALKNQLSPHFLFNSLNTISSLIHTDADRAEKFIRRLADTYQYVLGTHQQQLITLDKELEFVNAYYFLLQVRFPKGLHLKIEIPNGLYTYNIPPLTLQILIENAIKHNVFSIEEPLRIKVEHVGNEELRIVNNKTKPPIQVKSNYVGLKNIEKRFSYFTHKRVKIKNDIDFEVRIPIIKKADLSKVA